MTTYVPDGKVYRTQEGTVIEVIGETYANGLPGVICLNPEAPEGERIYRKVFTTKRIYLPEEYGLAVKEHVEHPDNFIISMNGYSRISPAQCQQYGVFPGEYEQACAAIIREAISHLRLKFKGAQLRLIYGASDLGVDMAIESVARDFNLYPLGFSCPRYMMYVKDDDMPVYVAVNSDAYADLYIKTLDLLIATGGREQALKHDILAACLYGKRIHFVDVLGCLSRNGGVPATVSNADGTVRVENAPAAFGRYVSFFSRDDGVLQTPPGGDKWDALFLNIQSVATAVCRNKMSPARMF
ncbi:MAG: hypothetical protein WCT08_06080 [Patescibacteria group bacterium]|jgi:hypothetical protein